MLLIAKMRKTGINMMDIGIENEKNRCYNSIIRKAKYGNKEHRLL